MSDSVRPHRRQPTRLAHTWDSPGKNTGVGCHFLLQCMKVKSEKWKWSRSFGSNSLRPHGLQPTRLLRPWDFPGWNLPKNIFYRQRQEITMVGGVHSWYHGISYTHNDICAPVFTAALFTIAKTRKQSKCPLTEGWMKQMWYMYAVKYYSAIKWMKCAICSNINGPTD